MAERTPERRLGLAKVVIRAIINKKCVYGFDPRLLIDRMIIEEPGLEKEGLGELSPLAKIRRDLQAFKNPN